MSGTEKGVHGGGVERRGFRVWGRVQGVGFRWATAREAEALGLKGVVRNRADGAVEVSAEGSAEALEDLASWLRRGPRGARVERVEVTGAELPIPAAGFRIG